MSRKGNCYTRYTEKSVLENNANLTSVMDNINYFFYIPPHKDYWGYNRTVISVVRSMRDIYHQYGLLVADFDMDTLTSQLLSDFDTPEDYDITILDGNSFDRYCQEFPDIYRDQIASAGCVLVSKMEGADRQTLEQLEQSIRQINPAAEIFTTHYSANPHSWWESLLSRPADPAQKLPGKAETPDLQNLGLTEVSLPSGNHLLLFLQGVVAGVFGDICRAKGYLPVGSGEQTAWLRFDVVDHNYSITGIEEMPDSRAVLIGKGLKKNWLREVLQKNLWVTEKK